MDHSAYKEMLSALLDGELHGAEREAARAHLETCADCRAYFDELVALRAALGDFEEFDAPEGFAAGVLARLRAGGTTAQERADSEITRERAGSAWKAPKKRVVRRRYAALAACAAVVLLAVYALPNALRMGGNSVARDSAIHATPSAATPAGASGAPDAPAAAPDMAAPQDPAAPSPGEYYAYVGGAAENTDGTALESAQEGEGVTAERGKADIPAAPENDHMANGAANSETYVTTATTEPGEKLSATGTEESPMLPLSRPEDYDGEFPVITLSGEGAEAWLAAHGWQGESGAWYADAAALRALPEDLAVVYSELSEDYDGAVLVELWEAEP